MTSLRRKTKQSVRFIVTGFGPFGGVPENPTTVLAEGLVNYLQQNGMDELASITNAFVIETSADGARSAIDRLLQEQEKRNSMEEDSLTILLHLGVNYQGVQFELESCAYNEATFRIPDEKGYLPQNVSILGKDAKVGLVLETLLDVNSLVDQINQTIEERHNQSNELVCCQKSTVSTDPGRFVCNYIYCYSLGQFKCSKIHVPTHMYNTNHRTRSLFLHVPPVTVVPQEQQFWFVSQLMNILYIDQRSSKS